MNLDQISAMTEDQAREHLERVMWPNGPVCPHCGATGNIVRIGGESARPGLLRCKDCRKQFTVTVNTIFADSHIPIRKWLMAFAIMCASKKGVSALQLQRQLSLGSYGTAWHMAHRIRHAMAKEPLFSFLRGVVEVDETYVGGKARKGPDNAQTARAKKTPVVALVERGGRVRAHAVERVTAANLKGAIRHNVDRRATIMTDDFVSYHGIGKEFAGGHHVVQHTKGEYARGTAHTNTVESYFALLKRGVIGSFHHVSKQHLNRYCDEFSFRWDRRAMTDGERTVEALRMSEGRRLMYRDPVAQKRKLTQI